ncbi:hypothetical protein J7E96_27315 [Streptomyces sp. ISL-96]|nr:hypothetical protein [Streptomyces sp. ISL-96]MBT2492159.1 hypothetical protein [Streptomyces sp. ISL-96]
MERGTFAKRGTSAFAEHSSLPERGNLELGHSPWVEVSHPAPSSPSGV